MASAVTLDASPTTLLRALRGLIVDAGLAYPEVLHVEVRDAGGGLWRLATQDAEWSPSDTTQLAGTPVKSAWIDQGTGELRLELPNGALRVIPGPYEAGDDPPNWELITPEGLLLEFGPGLRWQISRADAGSGPKAVQHLTKREREILTLVSDGLTTREIAERLALSSTTVARHVARVRAKLNIHASGDAERERDVGRNSLD